MYSRGCVPPCARQQQGIPRFILRAGDSLLSSRPGHIADHNLALNFKWVRSAMRRRDGPWTGHWPLLAEEINKIRRKHACWPPQ